VKISACVIAQNEERSLGRCLQSLTFADEIIVVDGGSVDNTVQVAQQYGRVVQQKFTGFTAQRNRALLEAKGDWVFFLDSDEEASPELARRLKTIAGESLNQHPNCYSIRREEYFLGQKLNFGPGNPSHQWRFFKRAGVSFEGQVHEFPVFQGGIGILEEPIHHWPDLAIDRFLVKMNHYTSLEAYDRFSQGQRTSLAHAVFTFFSTFLKNGVRYQGFRNGKVGLVLVLLESISRTVRHLKLWTYWQVYDGRLKVNLGFSLPAPGSVKAASQEQLERPQWQSPTEKI